MSEKKEVIEAMELFLKSADEANLEKLDDSMHKNYRNVQYGFFGDPGVFIIEKLKYKSLIEDGTFGGVPRKMDILSLDINGNLATARVNLKSNELTFHSTIILIQDEGQWTVMGNYPHVVVNPQ